MKNGKHNKVAQLNRGAWYDIFLIRQKPELQLGAFRAGLIVLLFIVVSRIPHKYLYLDPDITSWLKMKKEASLIAHPISGVAV